MNKLTKPSAVRSYPHKTDAETAEHIREYVRTRHDLFSWPTDAAGYDQHIRFVKHRNANWHGGTHEEWVEFCLSYADSLDAVKGNEPT